MRILLIEGESALACAVIEHLEADYHIVDSFAALDEAEAAVLGIEYEFVLVDLHQPDGDGLSFQDKLRDRRLRVPVIILTACDKFSDRIEGFKRGADNYIIKAFGLDDVTARIQTVLRRVSGCPRSLKLATSASRSRTTASSGVSAPYGLPRKSGVYWKRC